MRKSKVLVSLAAAALLSVGVGTIGQQDNVFTPQSVQAAKKTYKIKLKKNAKVFNKRGKRKGKKLLKKGHTYTTYGKKTIHGKKYYHLSKGRYIKAVNAKKVTKKAKRASTKTFSVTVNTPAKVYDAQGKATGITLNKGTVELAQGTTTIKGKKYYKIGTGKYILASAATEGNQVTTNTGTSETAGTNTPSSTPANNTNDSTSLSYGKPTQKEIDYLVDNGYVYFTDAQVKQIRDSLWQKIQDYRVSKGYAPYKSNPELDNFVNSAAGDNSNMYIYQAAVNYQDADQLAEYLPTLSEHGMSVSRGVDDPRFYAVNAKGQGYLFDLRDRNPEHVAVAIFNALKSDPNVAARIEGHKDKNAFGALSMKYFWDGTNSSLGLMFVEVAGNSSEWTSYYNAN
ncbi:SLAP domain-containing protein [Lactobacillus sp. ESL0681]|uniref:SLAP domain-containing protein n=1 Tax=Lactobacillus sp. ESL0681 TaxID=2983211 RepID=UPI0023F83654|nr:SLAP domain-containing protein [Lactobacillus sp. ESL0681]WEV41320.1 SLAP domain-containing protein [Lactobacillus sp. ESL0681]